MSHAFTPTVDHAKSDRLLGRIGKDLGIFAGTTGRNKWSGTLTADSDYPICVYLMRNSARRHEAAKLTP